MIASVVQTILQRQHRWQLYRFGVDLRAFVTEGTVSAPARVDDLSGIGAGFISPISMQSGDVVELRFEIEADQSVETQVKVMTVRPHGTGYRYGVEFVELSEAVRGSLILFLYQHHAPSLFGHIDDTPRIDALAAA